MEKLALQTHGWQVNTNMFKVICIIFQLARFSLFFSGEYIT